MRTSRKPDCKKKKYCFIYAPSSICYRDSQNRGVASQIAFLRTLYKWLSGKKFLNEKVEFAVDGYFAELDDSHYKQGAEAVEQCIFCALLCLLC